MKGTVCPDSSAGQSNGFLNRRSGVRVSLGDQIASRRRIHCIASAIISLGTAKCRRARRDDIFQSNRSHCVRDRRCGPPCSAPDRTAGHRTRTRDRKRARPRRANGSARRSESLTDLGSIVNPSADASAPPALNFPVTCYADFSTCSDIESDLFCRIHPLFRTITGDGQFQPRSSCKCAISGQRSRAVTSFFP